MNPNCLLRTENLPPRQAAWLSQIPSHFSIRCRHIGRSVHTETSDLAGVSRLADSNPSKRPKAGRSHAGKGAEGAVSMAGPVASASARNPASLDDLADQNPSNRSRGVA